MKLRFDYLDLRKPIVDWLSVSSGSVTGGTVVTMIGSGFKDPSTCRFGEVEVDGIESDFASPQRTSSTKVICRAPAHEKATVAVAVLGVDEAFAASSLNFES